MRARREIENLKNQEGRRRAGNCVPPPPTGFPSPVTTDPDARVRRCFNGGELDPGDAQAQKL